MKPRLRLTHKPRHAYWATSRNMRAIVFSSLSVIDSQAHRLRIVWSWWRKVGLWSKEVTRSCLERTDDMPIYGRTQRREPLTPSEMSSPRSRWARPGRPPTRRLTLLFPLLGYQACHRGTSAEEFTIPTDDLTTWNAIVEPTVNRVLVELEERYCERGLTLRSLGRRYGISPAHLGTIFAQAVGCSFRKYLRRLRVRKALALLTDPGRSVSEVA